ncbi:MAG TPA: AarF/ABC1/UbiB kinase family protein, partial [Firmicutes bacterium]|nr:AarF/ABC1/UbiB kinase family protein [Bacillota bacterium]
TGMLALPARILRRAEASDRLTAPSRVRLVLESLGPTFIKLGQLLSTRPDLIPPEYLQELAKLQDQVPPVPPEEIRALVTRELGRPLAEVFADFTDHPLASASVAQVHRASLKGGEQVVVKAQRPGIEEVIRVDLEILAEVAGALERRSPWAALYDFSGAVEEFARILQEELDFLLEAQNVDHFRHNFDEQPRVRFPRVYREYTTKRVLVLEFIAGTKITEVERLKQRGLRRRAIAESLIQALLKQIFVDGFFHGDPHPGNLLVDEEGRVVFLDLGMVGQLEEWTKRKLVRLVLGIVHRNPARIVAAMASLGVVEPETDLTKLRRDVVRVIGRYYHVPLKEFNVGEAMQFVLQLAFKHRLHIPTDLTLLAKALTTVEGIARRLDPTLSIVEVAEPFGRTLARQRLSWRQVQEWYENELADYGRTVLNLPVRLGRVLEKLGRGQLTVRHVHEGLEPAVERLAVMGNRLAVSILAAGIIVGTALLERTTGQGEIFKVPLGRIGFFAALVLGLWLLFSILKSGRV